MGCHEVPVGGWGWKRRKLGGLQWHSNGAWLLLEHVNGIHDCLWQFRPLFGYWTEYTGRAKVGIHSIVLYVLYQLCKLNWLFELYFVGLTAYCAHFGGGRRPAWRFNALDYCKIKHGNAGRLGTYGNAGRLGTYSILSVLPDKFARFLFEFHSGRFESLDLPILPDKRSQFDVHCALEDEKVKQLNMKIQYYTCLTEYLWCIWFILLYQLYQLCRLHRLLQY